MAYYDALIAKWPSVAGANTAAKLVALNALKVASPKAAILATADIKNTIQAADLIGLSALQMQQINFYIGCVDTLDASIGSQCRAAFVSIFTGKAATLAALTALVAPYDNATDFWTTVNGYGRIGLDDLVAAGGLT